MTSPASNPASSPATGSPAPLPDVDAVVRALAALRAGAPLVQCLTNSVSTPLVANALLAIGASPAMVDNPHEAAGFAAVAGAVLVNLGTPTDGQAEAMRLAVASAHGAGVPWVLDPVAVGPLPWRSRIALDLLASRPAVVRGNASEVSGLAGLGVSGKGPDSTADPRDAVPAAVALLDRADAVSASGEVDHAVALRGGVPQLVRVSGGSALLPRVTATGCALGAVVAAYCAVEPDALTALVAAHVHVAVAAELAARVADRPGSFAVAFVDGLDRVDEALVRELARIDPVGPVG